MVVVQLKVCGICGKLQLMKTSLSGETYWYCPDCSAEPYYGDYIWWMTV